MPTNTYTCARHGTREITFPKSPPRICGQMNRKARTSCKEPLVWEPEPQAGDGIGGDNWLFGKSSKDRILDKVELQLGERPRNAQHLRELEKKHKVERTVIVGASRWI